MSATSAPTKRIAIGVAAVLLVIVSGLLLKESGGTPVGPDGTWQMTMNSHRWAPAVALASALATLGGSTGATLTTAAVVIAHLALRRWRAAITIAASVSLGAAASTSIKLLAARPRPGDGLASLATFSFPSGHTTWAAALGAALAFALPRIWTWVLAGAWVALMAWSRTYLGVHWLSDVAAGAVLGLAVAVIVNAFLDRLGNRLPWLESRPALRRKSEVSGSSVATVDS